MLEVADMNKVRSPVKSLSLNDLTQTGTSQQMIPASRITKIDPVLQALESFRSDMSIKLNNIENHFNYKFDELKTETALRNESIDNKFKELTLKIEGLQSENKENVDTIEHLNKQLEVTQRMLIMNHVEIRKVPYYPEENLLEIVKTIGEKLAINISSDDIKSAYRLFSNNKDKMHIVVEFSNSHTKESILVALKKYNLAHPKNNLSSDVLGIPGMNGSKIYITELLLTPSAKQLFFEASSLAKLDNYKFCWVKRGKVFIKRDDESEPIYITSTSQIDSLKELAKSNIA